MGKRKPTPLSTFILTQVVVVDSLWGAMPGLNMVG